MKSSGNQVLVLIIGLLLGVMAGGGLAWYFLGNTGKNIIIVNQVPKEVEKSDEKKKKTTFKKKPSEKPKATTEEIIDDNENSLTDSLSNESMAVFSENGLVDEEGKTMISDVIKDTLEKDSLLIGDLHEENIIVKKDELLLSKNIPVTDLTKPDPSNKKDSLLQILRGAKDPAPTNFIMVEYWKSPINYKGYKMGKNKIILFGLPNSEKAEVFRINEQLYFKSNNKTYRLQNSLEFKSYELVTDQHILNQLVVK